MDLNDFLPKSDTTEVILVHPKTQEPLLNDDGSEMTIEVWLPHSKHSKDIRYSQADELIAEGKKGLKTAESERLQLTILAKSVKAWDITLKGQQPEVSFDVAYQIFDDFAFIRRQVEEAIDKAEAFI
jgi:hypothetical protein